MRYSSKSIRTGYYNALNNVVLFNSNGVPFYDSVPSNPAGYPYMYMSGYSAVEASYTKDSFCQKVLADITIVMKYSGNSGGESDIDGIADQITSIVRGSSAQSPQTLSFLPLFNLVLVYLNLSWFERKKVADGIIYKRTLQFKHIIEEI
jgi:hypothetical protein